MAYSRRLASFQAAYRPALEGRAERRLKGQSRTCDWGPQAQASLDWGIRAHSRSFAVSTIFSFCGWVRPVIGNGLYWFF